MVGEKEKEENKTIFQEISVTKVRWLIGVDRSLYVLQIVFVMIGPDHVSQCLKFLCRVFVTVVIPATLDIKSLPCLLVLDALKCSQRKVIAPTFA